MRAVLFSAISAWKQGLEMLFFFFFPRCRPALGMAFRGKFAQAGPSGTETNEEWHWCKGVFAGASSSTHNWVFNPEGRSVLWAPFMYRLQTWKQGGMCKCSEWVSVFLFLCVYRRRWIERLVCLRFKNICCGVSMSYVYFFYFIIYLRAPLG